MPGCVHILAQRSLIVASPLLTLGTASALPALGMHARAMLHHHRSALPCLFQVLGCMRIAGQAHGRVYAAVSKLFVAQFFLFRWAAASCA